ncbi:uncharacterized protein Z519_03038 [Cladophialophora bantiana CBS 173.52]|uniref:Uncharacterized protein n=1 Tax=Cladophialophora bantiana (strain ATCC 10958 / CBS 173.52 / CDC B-1940 / NIH 8579) TaxID=1442370 RepID=A0A0D2GBR5_CLAB1|nr:uncharacterized protein Z519_03038 [Cladophialophora bantiana CBS 173.52]KIW95972.1 hypothetical protein Z519_03038 [Cladophialophora bantiana CBS 173.52]
MDIVCKQAVLAIVGTAGSNCEAGLPRSHPGAPRITPTTAEVGGRTFMLAQPSLDLVLGKTI